MDLTAPWISVITGTICGVISAFGIGGGSLLMVWMTAAAMLEQRTAQGINLIYFIPTSVAALIFHFKNKMICKQAIIPAILSGAATAVIFAWLANTIEVDMLRKLFGGFLCIIGVKEFFYKVKKEK